MKLSRTNFLWQLLPRDPVYKSSSLSVHPAPHLWFLNTFRWWDPHACCLWVAIQVQTFPTCSPTTADLQRKGTWEQAKSWAPLDNIWKDQQRTNCWAFGNLGNLLLSIASNPQQCKWSSDGDEPRLQPLMREEFGLFRIQDKTWLCRGWKSTHGVSAASQGTVLLLWGFLPDTSTLTLLSHPSPQWCRQNIQWKNWIDQSPEDPPRFGHTWGSLRYWGVTEMTFFGIPSRTAQLVGIPVLKHPTTQLWRTYNHFC